MVQLYDGATGNCNLLLIFQLIRVQLWDLDCKTVMWMVKDEQSIGFVSYFCTIAQWTNGKKADLLVQLRNRKLQPFAHLSTNHCPALQFYCRAVPWLVGIWAEGRISVIRMFDSTILQRKESRCPRLQPSQPPPTLSFDHETPSLPFLHT